MTRDQLLERASQLAKGYHEFRGSQWEAATRECSVEDADYLFCALDQELAERPNSPFVADLIRTLGQLGNDADAIGLNRLRFRLVNDEQHIALLESLASIGGPNALQAIKSVALSTTNSRDVICTATELFQEVKVEGVFEEDYGPSFHASAVEEDVLQPERAAFLDCRDANAATDEIKASSPDGAVRYSEILNRYSS